LAVLALASLAGWLIYPAIPYHRIQGALSRALGDNLASHQPALRTAGYRVAELDRAPSLNQRIYYVVPMGIPPRTETVIRWADHLGVAHVTRSLLAPRFFILTDTSGTIQRVHAR